MLTSSIWLKPRCDKRAVKTWRYQHQPKNAVQSQYATSDQQKTCYKYIAQYSSSDRVAGKGTIGQGA
jgi:hypothetical protein